MTTRSWLYLLFILAVLALAGKCSHAETRWHRVATVEAVAVTVHELREHELLELVGARLFQAERLRGYSQLRRNRETGAYTCDIYLTSSAREVLEHELKHCNGWTHK